MDGLQFSLRLILTDPDGKTLADGVLPIQVDMERPEYFVFNATEDRVEMGRVWVNRVDLEDWMQPK